MPTENELLQEDAIRQYIGQDATLAYLKPDLLAERISQAKLMAISADAVARVQSEIKKEHQER